MLESKVTEMLGQLAEKLGVASAKIWEWSLLQVKVELVTNIITLLLAIAVTIACVKYATWVQKSWDDFEVGGEMIHISLSITLVILLVTVNIFGVIALLEIPKLLINPEYAAFQNIVEQLGKLK